MWPAWEIVMWTEGSQRNVQLYQKKPFRCQHRYEVVRRPPRWCDHQWLPVSVAGNSVQPPGVRVKRNAQVGASEFRTDPQKSLKSATSHWPFTRCMDTW